MFIMEHIIKFNEHNKSYISQQNTAFYSIFVWEIVKKVRLYKIFRKEKVAGKSRVQKTLPRRWSLSVEWVRGMQNAEEGDAESERIEGSRGCEYEGRETFKTPLVYCEGNLSHLFAYINKSFCFIGCS